MRSLARSTFLLCLLIMTGLNAKMGSPVAKAGFEWTRNDLRSVFMLNADDGWTVGQGGTVLHWDGAAWKTVESPTWSLLTSVYMVNATDGWAVGVDGAIIHWNGTAWADIASPTSEDLYGVFMVNATDGWAVGGTPGGSPSAVILRWNGTAWNTVSSPTSNWLRSVFMVSSDDGWAASGTFGTIIRWNGTAWNTVTVPTSTGFNSVVMVNATDGWATCFDGQIIHWDGVAWSNFTKPTSQSLRSVFMLNATEGWIVGDSDILRWNGTAWDNVPKPEANWLFSVFMVEADDGWAVGDFGLILHWDGTEWVISQSPIYQGDLLLSDNEVYTIENQRFDINGSIIVEENATLILRNAFLNFTQKSNAEHEMTFRNPLNGNPRLLVENATIIASNYYLWVSFYGNSSATMTNLTAPSYIDLDFHGFSFAEISNSSTYALYASDSSIVNVSICTFEMLWGSGSSEIAVSNSIVTGYSFAQLTSLVNIANSTINQQRANSRSINCSIVGLKPDFVSYWNFLLNCSVAAALEGWAPNISLADTQVNEWQFAFNGLSNATISNCDLLHISLDDFSFVSLSDSSLSVGVSCYDNSEAHIHNSTIGSLDSYDDSRSLLVNSTCTTYYIHEQSEVYACWYLDVHVVYSNGTGVPFANVTATYPNATVAESKLANADGWARFTLTEKMMNATGSYPIGNYTITAEYDTYQGQQSVNMTENKVIIIPEFPSFLILPLFMIATLLAVIFYRKKHSVSQKHQKRPITA